MAPGLLAGGSFRCRLGACESRGWRPGPGRGGRVADSAAGDRCPCGRGARVDRAGRRTGPASDRHRSRTGGGPALQPVARPLPPASDRGRRRDETRCGATSRAQLAGCEPGRQRSVAVPRMAARGIPGSRCPGADDLVGGALSVRAPGGVRRGDRTGVPVVLSVGHGVAEAADAGDHGPGAPTHR